MSPAALKFFEQLRRELADVFPRIQLVAPRDLTHMHELVRRSAGTHRMVLAVGGDGTLHQCLAALDPTQQALGILPCGSGNDFARSLAFPRGLQPSIARLSSLCLRPTDFGIAAGQRYINSAGFGIDTETLKLRRRSSRFWQANYNLLFVRALAAMPAWRVKLSWAGAIGAGSQECSEEGNFFWLLGMNSPLIGGGTRIAPLSSLDDGLLDMVCIRRVPKLELLRRMPDAIAGRHLDMAELTLFHKVTSFTVELEQPLDYLALDGELLLCAQRRIEFKVNPKGLEFLR